MDQEWEAPRGVAAAAQLRALRKDQGALTFGSIEATPVVENDQVKDLTVTSHNVAQDIIESFMVAANVAMAEYLGASDAFDKSITDFSERYADQNQRDYQEFVTAIRSGRLEAVEGV